MKTIILILFFLLVETYDIIGSRPYYPDLYQANGGDGYSFPPQGSQPSVARENFNPPEGLRSQKNNLLHGYSPFDASHLKSIREMSNEQIQYFNMQLKAQIESDLKNRLTDNERQRFFNMLINTNTNEIIDTIAVDNYNYKRCRMEKKTEPHAWFSNPKYHYIIGCGISREKVIVDLTIKRGVLGGNVADIKIDDVKINYYINNFKKWSEGFLQIMTGKSGKNIKSKANKWWQKRKKIALGTLAVGAASAAGIAGGYMIGQNYDISQDGFIKKNESQ